MSPSATQDALSRELTPEFEILGLLGSGHTSHVFRAREPALQRLVAIKVLRSDVGADESVRARFEREGRAQAGISDPSVPSIHRVGRLASGLPYLVLEYLEGRTLADRLEASGAVATGEARTILAQLAGALAAAHDVGVVHRDVRPDNVMIRKEDGRAMLMDFGLAGVLASGTQAGSRITRTGEIIGDPHYASPEQLRGEQVTAETDVYSLGVLGYEVLTCTNPFGTDSVKDLVSGHLSREPDDLPWSVLGNDRALGDLLKRCLRKEPAKRPRAEELVVELQGGDRRRGAATGARTGAGVGSGTAAGTGAGPGGLHGAPSLLQNFPRLHAFVNELRRRRVYQVAVAYMVVGLGVLGAAEVVLDPLGLSAARTFIVIFTLAGFPIALILAWIFDLTTSGIRRTEDVPEHEELGRGWGRVLKIAGLIVSVCIAVVVGWLVLR